MLGAALGAVGNVVGAVANNAMAGEAADEAWSRHKRVLKNQVSWRVKDSVKAGLHPLAALGMSPAGGPGAAQVFDSGIGNAASSIAQAADAYASPEMKLSKVVASLQLERGKLENDLLRTQIASQRQQILTRQLPGLAPLSNDPAPALGGELVVPGIGAWKVANASLGQDAEQAYSDIGGNIFGTLGLLYDAGANYKRLTDTYVSPQIGKVFDYYNSLGPRLRRFRMSPPPRGGGY